jgi:hypothetical protein
MKSERPPPALFVMTLTLLRVHDPKGPLEATELPAFIAQGEDVQVGVAGQAEHTARSTRLKGGLFSGTTHAVSFAVCCSPL